MHASVVRAKKSQSRRGSAELFHATCTLRLAPITTDSGLIYPQHVVSRNMLFEGGNISSYSRGRERGLVGYREYPAL